MKRSFDVFLVIFFSPIIFPAFVCVWILVRWWMGEPVFFSQARGGLGGSSFQLWKFRSMSDDRDSDGNPLPDSERLNNFGLFLRSTSLDEIPSLFNVLKGEMSLVGPRPLIADYLPLYDAYQARRHEVLPGITGWAQVNGRNAISWEDKFKLDVWYVDHHCLLLDVKILWLTVKKVLGRDGISASGEATVPRFTGSQRRD